MARLKNQCQAEETCFIEKYGDISTSVTMTKCVRILLSSILLSEWSETQNYQKIFRIINIVEKSSLSYSLGNSEVNVEIFHVVYRAQILGEIRKCLFAPL